MNRNFHSVHLAIILPLNILIYSAALSALFRGQLHAYKLGKDETKKPQKASHARHLLRFLGHQGFTYKL